jgi:hypothetical protein
MTLRSGSAAAPDARPPGPFGDFEGFATVDGIETVESASEWPSTVPAKCSFDLLNDTLHDAIHGPPHFPRQVWNLFA